jgi:hypothetical protein
VNIQKEEGRVSRRRRERRGVKRALYTWCRCFSINSHTVCIASAAGGKPPVFAPKAVRSRLFFLSLFPPLFSVKVWVDGFFFFYYVRHIT